MWCVRPIDTRHGSSLISGTERDKVFRSDQGPKHITQCYFDGPKVLNGECSQHGLLRMALQRRDERVLRVVQLQLLELGADACDGLELGLLEFVTTDGDARPH